jgi:hypothetical protein
MPQYKGSMTSREPSTFQNNIHFLAHYFPGPTTISQVGWYANFYKDTVNARIDLAAEFTTHIRRAAMG